MERSGEKIESRGSLSKKELGAPATYPRSWLDTDIGAFLQLVLMAIAGSVIVAAYVFIIGLLNRTKSNIDATAQSALYAARELSQIYVDSNSFGRVGLCDKDVPGFSGFGYGYGNLHVTGIETIHKTLQLDQSISRKLNRPLMTSLIDKDLENAKKVETELTERLFEAAEPDLLAGGNGTQPAPINTNTASTIYRTVYHALSVDRTSKDNSLIEVRIKLGRLKEEAHALPAPEPTGIQIVDNSMFVASDQKHAPNLVLIEGIYQSKTGDNSEPIRTITSSRCALISAAPVQPPASTFLLFFPDGKPTIFNSVTSILRQQKWDTQGSWQQAVGSEVPGRGSLAPSLQPVLPEMSPADALSVALYHWLRQLGPNVDETKVLNLLNEDWVTLGLRGESARLHSSANPEPNSCLAIDTGAREYAILNQTAPGGSGQAALCQAFNIPMAGIAQATGVSRFPPSAIPIYVDETGSCNLSGRNAFDKKLVLEFQNSLYETNLAAVESLAVAKLVIARINSELTQLDQKIFIEKQELASVINRLERLRRQAANENLDTALNGKSEAARKIELAANTVESLKANITEDEEQRKALRHTNEMAIVTLDNATRVANETYEMCAHTFKLCKEGIWRIDKPHGGYVISRHYCFQPFVQAISGSDFLGDVDQVTEARTYWFGHKVHVLQELTEKDSPDFTIEGLTWNRFQAQQPIETGVTPVAIFLTSQGLSRADKTRAKPLVLVNYPFDNIRLPNGELLYYCQDAISTGATSDSTVSWSVLMRDFVASRMQTGKTREAGIPMQSGHRDWCRQESANNLCPGLAAEFQLRTPLPKLSQSAEGSYLTNPTNNAQIPQIPPVPSDLL